MIYLAIYIVILLVIGVIDFFRAKGFQEFALAGRRQKSPLVVMSLLATILGASATVGLIEKGGTLGFPAFWWLGVGVIGLAFQALFLTKKVRNIGAVTLPDLAGKTIGGAAKKLTAVIIVLAWTGIVAAQFVTAGKLITVLLGMPDPGWVLFAVSGSIILYSILGGQSSVLKTDFLQGGIILAAIVTAFVILFFFSQAPQSTNYEIALFNDKFGPGDMIGYLLIVGGTYFVGPDMFSRIFTAKDAKTAQRSVWTASILLLLAGVLIAMIGVWGRANIPSVPGTDILGTILGRLPEFARILLIFGFLSAVLSSADTCLLSAGTILERDILGKERVGWIRVWIGIIGVVASLITVFRQDIIGLLVFAYSIYTPGVVVPLAGSILFFGKRKPHPYWMTAGIALGGLCGAAAKALEMTKTLPQANWLVYTGIGISAVFTLIAMLKGTSSAASVKELA
ncbi:MAG: hypothetical protein A2Y33_16135 [Spirochaetes bacterium GWF1_51_8]|nr:MAG: hypothetical protein A2Y33_16135 [Spirochaetes bacterium GWF1_51_8]